MATSLPRFARVPASAPFAACVLCLHACSDPRSGPSVTVRDSAGIPIVEAHWPVWTDTTRWRIDPEPVLDLARRGLGQVYSFSLVRGMGRLSDGSIAVGNTGSNEIRQFTPEGYFVASAGGEGEGPGQFTGMRQLELVGDSLFARDSDGRVAVFAPGPKFVRAMRPDHPIESLRSLGDGTLVGEVAIPAPARALPGLFRDERALVRLDMAGALLDTIGRTAGREHYADNAAVGATPLFAKSSHFATHDGRIYYGAADIMQVRELGPGGELLRILRIPDYPLALTDKQIEAEREARGEGMPPLIRDAVETMPAPGARPAFSDLLVDPAGAIWLRPHVGAAERDEPAEWLVLDSAGTWLGGVEVPAGFRIWQIRSDEVLGTWVDRSGSPHPQVLRLRRGGGAGAALPG